MSDALDDLRNETTTWYLSLDPRTRDFFEAAYSEAPRVVVRAIGGGQIGEAELGGHASLASVLDAVENDVASVVPYIGIDGSVTLTPQAPTSERPTRVSWTDCNYGTATDGYVDRIAVIDASNQMVTDDSIERGPLEVGGRGTVEHTLAALRPGQYTIRILHNANGVDHEHAQYATRRVGISTYTDVPIEVTEPTQLDREQAWQEAVAQLAAADSILRDAIQVDAPGPYADAIDAYAAVWVLGSFDMTHLAEQSARIRGAADLGDVAEREDVNLLEAELLASSANLAAGAGTGTAVFTAVVNLAEALARTLAQAQAVAAPLAQPAPAAATPTFTLPDAIDEAGYAVHTGAQPAAAPAGGDEDADEDEEDDEDDEAVFNVLVAPAEGSAFSDESFEQQPYDTDASDQLG
jgi:hypothetical protein